MSTIASSTGNYIYDKAIISVYEFNEEFNTFNKILDSSRVLKESNIILEFSLTEVKNKIKALWEKFKNFVKNIFEAIKEKFTNLIQKFKKQKVDKAVDELEKNEKNASKEELQAAYEKLFNSIYDNEDPDKHLWISYFIIQYNKIIDILNTCSSEKLFTKLVSIDSLRNAISDQNEIEKIKKHNDDIEKQIIEPQYKFLEEMDKYDTKFDPKTAVSDKIEHIHGDDKTYIYPTLYKFYKYHTPMSVIKEILHYTPEDFYFSSNNPLDKTINKYEKELSKALAGDIEGDNISYLMSGLSYDISMMRKQVDLNRKLYLSTYDAITYNMKVVYYLAERFNVYLGRMTDEEYRKLNNYSDVATD